ncbi:MAG: HAD family hydrolase [Lentisphaerae bacterium]|nr:HAD family hydrolase [Lentisphaerota bacterium]
MRFQAYFFDFDGTIGATEVDIRASWLAALDHFGLPKEPFYQHFQIGPTPLESIAMLYPDMPLDRRKMFFETYKSLHDDAEHYLARPYPGIAAMLQKLHQAGKKIYIVTNKRYKPLYKLVRQFGFAQYIDGLFVPDIIDIDPEKHLKKSDSLALAMRVAGVSAEESLMVGDTAIDITVGKSNRTMTCAVTWGYGSYESLKASSPDYLIDHPKELP